MDTGLIPRISGEFDSASFRVGPAPLPEREEAGSPGEEKYLPEEELPGSTRGGRLRDETPLPGRRTFQGKPGQNPYFRTGRKRKK
jgi:putative peptidoglycan lipid II flippase